VFKLPKGDDEKTKTRYLRSVKFYTAFFGVLAAIFAALYSWLEKSSSLQIQDIFNLFAATQVVFFVPLMLCICKPDTAPGFHRIAKWSMFLSFLTALLCAIVGAFFLRGKDGRDLLESAPLLAFLVSLATCALASLVVILTKAWKRRKERKVGQK
jgi:hypothetical protein